MYDSGINPLIFAEVISVYHQHDLNFILISVVRVVLLNNLQYLVLSVLNLTNPI